MTEGKAPRPFGLLQLGLFLLVTGILATVMLRGSDARTAAAERRPHQHPDFRTVVVVMDSVGVGMAFDPKLMPFVASLQSKTLHGRAKSCPGNATFPCIKTLFEGREATMGTTLQNFSAGASVQLNWPTSVAALGVKVVATSDHTLNRLYPGAWVDSFNYETVPVDIMGRDAYAFRHAFAWLDDPAIGAFVFHEIGTDKVSHEYKVRGPEYVKKYLEVDEFIRQVAGRLGQKDYLYLMADHGHNEIGGHTRDAAYLIRGPLFPEGKRLDIDATDMLAFLSLPYDLPVPLEYEGHVNTGILELPTSQRLAWLARQARALGISDVAESADTLEAQINAEIDKRHVRNGKQATLAMVFTLAPWLSSALILLVAWLWGFLGHKDESPTTLATEGIRSVWLWLGLAGAFALARVFPAGAWLLPLATFGAVVKSDARRGWVAASLALAAFVFAAFYLAPRWLTWWHRGPHRGPGMLIFFSVAVMVAVLFERFAWSRARAVRGSVERVLYSVALLTFTISLFGVYFYSLTRLGPIVLLAAVAIAVLLARRPQAFVQAGVFGLLGFVPLMKYEAESYNLDFAWLSALEHASFAARLSILAALVLALGLGVGAGKAVSSGRALGLLAAWAAVSVSAFGFQMAQVIGFLCAALGFWGTVSVIDSAGLPRRWVTLAAGVCLFLASWVAFNGFALSRIDFRFASHWVYPFQVEFFRAAELILCAWIKYAFVWVPIGVVFAIRLPDRAPILRGLTTLIVWRLAAIVLSALGLRLFSTAGIHELCSEEIYYWAWFALVAWLLALQFERRPALVVSSSGV